MLQNLVLHNRVPEIRFFVSMNNYVVPYSCCSDLEGADYNTCVTKSGMSNLPDGSFTQGCWQKFQDDVITANQNYILYSGITIIVIMVRITLISNFIESI